MTKLLLSLTILLAAGVRCIAADSFKAIESEKTIVLQYGGEAFLTYHKAEVPPPKEADPIFKRSGFIHPLKSPIGATVTGIHPSDHYHHLGLWHAWVNCKHDGQAVDFWNLKTGTGRIGYKKTLTVISTENQAGFVVEQAHIAYKGETKEPVTVLHEVFSVNARMAEGALEIDYETVQVNVTDHALEFPAYRYGGPIAYRAPHHWKNGNSDYLSSDGKTRIDGHQTRSHWVAMYGPAGTEKNDPVACLTILSDPKNHDAPQRMRVWPPSSNDGAIFFNYVPIQQYPWAIKPGQTSTMRYRLVVSDAKPDPEALNARWERYAKETK